MRIDSIMSLSTFVTERPRAMIQSTVRSSGRISSGRSDRVEHEGERDEAGFGDAGDAHRGDHARAGGDQLLAEREIDAARLRDEQHRHALVENDAVVVEVRADTGAERRRRARHAQPIERAQRDRQRREALVRAGRVDHRLLRLAPERAERHPREEQEPRLVGDERRAARGRATPTRDVDGSPWSGA